MPTLFYSKATEVFSKIDTRAMFITIHNYVNNYGEVATHSLCWHINYPRAVQKAWDIMSKFKPSNSFCANKKYSLIDLQKAYDEWLESLSDTLVYGPGKNHRATSAHVYDSVIGTDGKFIRGIKIHSRRDVIHLTDVYRLRKTVHKPGNYPNTVHARKTLAKRDLRQMTPLKRWGQFVLELGRFEKLTVSKITLREQHVMNEWSS